MKHPKKNGVRTFEALLLSEDLESGPWRRCVMVLCDERGPIDITNITLQVFAYQGGGYQGPNCHKDGTVLIFNDGGL